jgi:hypothetical protein
MWVVIGRRAAFVGLVVFLALVLYTSVSLGGTLDGCSQIMTRVVCEPGAALVVPPI